MSSLHHQIVKKVSPAVVFHRPPPVQIPEGRLIVAKVHDTEGP
jgi:hypothetical protein